MITQIKKPSDDTVTAAKIVGGWLHLRIAGRWAVVVGKPRFLNDGAMILLSVDGDTYFSDHYLAYFHGDPTDSAAPMEIEGGLTDPVVCYMAERWLADYLPVAGAEETVIPVPTLAQARAALPGLRARRHEAEGMVL